MWEVWQCVVTVDFLPFLCYIWKHISVFSVHAREVDELVVGYAVKCQCVKLASCRRAVGIHTADVCAVFSPGCCLQVEAWESSLGSFLPEPVQSLAASVHPSQAVYQILDFVYHEDRTAINLVVIGLREILVDNSVDDDFELCLANCSAPYNSGRKRV